ncbi:MAG TPA: hypothetical protein VE994_04325 [Terriglobales bacterium]|nr:hypothetical protein [Terriglobales bacterium]
MFLTLTAFAQTTEPTKNDDRSKSWTTTADIKTNHVNPTRIIESHSENGNRTLDKESVQILGRDGHYEAYQDIEKETVQVDANTVRITTRTFGRDVNREKSLVQVTEEQKRILPSGESKVERLTSDTDVNGKLKLVQHEIVETKRIGKNLEETNTTVMLPSTNGGLTPAYKSRELRKQAADGVVESETTTLLPDGEGRFQVVETRKNTTRQEGKERSTEERISRLDSVGKLGEVSRVASKESESTSGEKLNTVETYSLNVTGTSQDGNLHLVQRTTTKQRTGLTGEQVTEQKVEQINRDDPNSGLRLSVLINDTMQPGPSGVQATHTVRMRDPNGNFDVVSVDTAKSDRVPTIQIDKK